MPCNRLNNLRLNRFRCNDSFRPAISIENMGVFKPGKESLCMMQGEIGLIRIQRSAAMQYGKNWTPASIFVFPW